MKKFNPSLFYREKTKNKYLSKVDVSDLSGCWIWTAYCNEFGYGVFSIKRKPVYAHRVSWANWIGEIPENKLILHKCDNPKCIRPDHLFLGNQTDNMRDMARKKRGNMGKKTHCPKGHELSKNNLIQSRFKKTGYRSCLTCSRYNDKLRKRKYKGDTNDSGVCMAGI